jgi:peptide chain release factor subunit 3
MAAKPAVASSKAIPDHILKKIQDKPAKPVKTKVKEEKIVVSKVQEELVEVDETRAPVSIVFIGHVDAGKSTISG